MPIYLKCLRVILFIETSNNVPRPPSPHYWINFGRNQGDISLYPLTRFCSLKCYKVPESFNYNTLEIESFHISNPSAAPKNFLSRERRSRISRIFLVFITYYYRNILKISTCTMKQGCIFSRKKMFFFPPPPLEIYYVCMR